MREMLEVEARPRMCPRPIYHEIPSEELRLPEQETPVQVECNRICPGAKLVLVRLGVLPVGFYKACGQQLPPPEEL